MSLFEESGRPIVPIPVVGDFVKVRVGRRVKTGRIVKTTRNYADVEMFDSGEIRYYPPEAVRFDSSLMRRVVDMQEDRLTRWKNEQREIK